MLAPALWRNPSGWRDFAARPGISPGWQAVVFVTAVAAIFSRLPGALLAPQFFAEDGWVWYQQAYNFHWWQALAMPQAGYLQTLPRLVAALTLLFPMQWAPLLMNLAGAALQALPVVALLSRRCVTWGPLPFRMLMAGLYIAQPNAPEIHIVLTNAMWHFALLEALLAFSAPPQTMLGRMLDVVVFVVGALTGPFCILLMPLVAWYWWRRRERWTRVVLGFLAAGALIQGTTLVHAMRAPGAPLGITWLRLLRIVAGNIFINSMTGSGGSYLQTRWLFAACVGGLLVLVWAWRNASQPLRLYILFALLVLAASLRDPLLLNTTTARWEALASVAGIRYWFLPSLGFIWSAASLATLGRTWWMRCAGLGVLFLIPIGVVHAWTYPAWPPGHWSDDVKQFQLLKPGERMAFSVYDPGNRSMVLIKH